MLQVNVYMVKEEYHYKIHLKYFLAYFINYTGAGIKYVRHTIQKHESIIVPLENTFIYFANIS